MARRDATETRIRWRAALVAALLLGLTVVGGTGAPAPTERVSLAADGTQGNGFSFEPAISADGRFVAFSSSASNLVSGDTNGVDDVFVHDRQAGTTERVSVASDGAQGNGESSSPALSADGRFVAFHSFANNLVAGDTNGAGAADVFVRDRQAGITERVSVAADGAQANSSSFHPAISADGRVVAFGSFASNLVPGDTNGVGDTFVRDRQAGITERISIAADGTQANNDSMFRHFPALSANGRVVGFASLATNLVVGDTNGVGDVFVRDRQAGTTERVSVAADGAQANRDSVFVAGAALSADGRVVAFTSDASNLVPGDTNSVFDVFVRDRQAGTTERVSVACGGAQANVGGFASALSADGRFVAFVSLASNLVPNDSAPYDIFVHDRQRGTTDRVSSASGAQVDGSSLVPALSADGRVVAFASSASNLVAGDTNGVFDVFVRAAPPIVGVNLRQETARPVAEALTGLAPDQHIIDIQNGRPGLRSLRLTVNGRVLPMLLLRDGEERTMDVTSYMKPGPCNIIKVETPWGTPGRIGGSAVVTVGP